jgi:uncharacterized membrane protein YedE/YeeE
MKPAAESKENWLLAALFGLTFGFLLQKAGMGKYEVLVGQLLLQDWAVAKVMLTAILVGMVGVFTLHSMGKVQLHYKPTRLGANIVGGLLFGAGFALLGYCPGSAAAALGEGHWDAIFGMVGLVAGSYLYAELSETSSRTIERWGHFGKMTLPELVGVRRERFVMGFAVMLGLVLLVLHWATSGS